MISHLDAIHAFATQLQPRIIDPDARALSLEEVEALRGKAVNQDFAQDMTINDDAMTEPHIPHHHSISRRAEKVPNPPGNWLGALRDGF
jgi:hypothetical protein